jgi:hypothetical protein
MMPRISFPISRLSSPLHPDPDRDRRLPPQPTRLPRLRRRDAINTFEGKKLLNGRRDVKYFRFGDDSLQMQARGYVAPDAFTHGTSAQRVQWFRRGIETGSLKSGNTFATARP